jgi:hemerythrin
MAKIEWTDDLSIGVGLIDEQHKMLIQHLNRLSSAIKSHLGPGEIANTLDFLIKYTDFHFSEEEKHMAANHYPELENHILQHNEFKKTLASMELDFKEDGATHTLAESIDTLLFNWLVKHIQGVDQKFGTFLKDNNIVIKEES